MDELTMMLNLILYIYISSLCMPETHFYFSCSENVCFTCLVLNWKLFPGIANVLINNGRLFLKQEAAADV